jgi:ABC-type transporter Mla subunit MlaD
MMARPSYEKLGLFVLLAIAGVVVFGFVLGIRTSPTETYHTYFDESVQGLDTGALVKYRGVRIGSVGAIDVASDGTHIHVALELDSERVRVLGIADAAPRLRARLSVVGITGLKLIDIAPADDSTSPPPTLTFSTPAHYIPARMSLMVSLEGIVERVGDKLPIAIDHAITTLASVDAIAKDAHRADLPGRFATAADRVASAAVEIRRAVSNIDDRTGRAATKLNAILDKVDGPDGLVASARRASDFVGEVGHSAVVSANDLEKTMRELRDAARAMRGFFDDLGRQPDMIVKGRSKPRSR